MKIGIISGSLRKGRKSTSIAKWVLDHCAGYDAEFELLELAEFGVPLLTSATTPGSAHKQYDSPEVQAWSAAIDACDAFVFVTPEYNHGVPGGFKNAFDSLAPEWVKKPVAFVSYGADPGIRAVEQWRVIVANFHMFDVRATVALSLFTDFENGTVRADERLETCLANTLTELVEITAKLA